jgi:hypothetical protein
LHHLRVWIVTGLFIIAPCCASACERFHISVFPFDVYENTILTAAELNRRFRLPTEYVIVSYIKAQGSVSSDPKNCTLTVGYKEPTLYVAKEANDNPCANKRVFAEERKRLQIYERSAATLRARATAVTKRLKDDISLGSESTLIAALLNEVEAASKEVAAYDGAVSHHALPFTCDGVLIPFLP